MTVRLLHNQAMEKVDDALVERHNGNCDAVIRLYREAYALEMQAIVLLDEKTSAEYSMSKEIMLRSAAHLALNAGLYQECIETAGKGLAIARMSREIHNLDIARRLAQWKLFLAAKGEQS